MSKNIFYTFDNVSSTGLDKVPVNAPILIEDAGSGIPKFIMITDKTGITSSSTVTDLLALTSQWKGLGINNPIDPANITQDSTHRFVSDTEKGTWNGKISTVSADTAPQLGGDLDGNAKKIKNLFLTQASNVTPTNGATVTLDYSSEQIKRIICTSGYTLTIAFAPTGVGQYVVVLENGGALGTLNLPAGILKPGGSLTGLTTTGVDILIFTKYASFTMVQFLAKDVK